MEPKRVAEGKTKIVYEFDPEHYLLRFKDSITAGDGARKDELPGKGTLNAQTSALFFRLLEKNDIRTHYVGMYDEKTMIVTKLKMIPVEVVLRNIATGSIVKRLPIKEGEVFDPPIVEFFLKDDLRHDPLLNYSHLQYFNLLTRKEAEIVEEVIVKVNAVMKNFLKERGLVLYDLKLEFGKDKDNNLIVGDEITLDSMRVRDEKTNKILDKDLYRKGESLEVVKKAYEDFFNLISR
ncbi:phosphoribosylaminoimidazolesuccinocarboxamide synthase [Sulfolobus acidocaldarius]|uniref:Phosphoribosylaminoimidazole-succinocarboxamide synthase n=4 Tax=Sulfolobus acidocaldarius TaxID=2285 RepID=PUR7_SULAC|nr:phosphoribosylaminoimidazolesuccinocarboxamide synthase [Sulfolobus acidocaldarius]Q4J8G0.1 RecName: Full=Phosphoribosylaminoimidazole-succinocarboxamide synthase; AltName: Full=SAICAR synthetase [Sulfolobus acidocaldarius DSM 639]AAY80920.1 phosphoribosylaminoimidazole-succinocarboxamide synthase [Sulfolobus acidocaldarius DSM 639]AGE71520.1 phosphoribosylaminoimidazole-succinocarboxamide synthase [Sulfolobus acidocaldarius N8]AGE73793.1 phosphoribosylaminoimidazole-succinocarboxamide synth